MAQSLVSLAELSALLDDELSAADKAAVNERLARCQVSRQLLERLRGLNQELAASFLAAGNDPLAAAGTGTARCLDDETLLALSEGRLRGARLAAVETHAQNCDLCLRRLILGARLAKQMAAANWPALPKEVTADPRLSAVAALHQRREEFVAKKAPPPAAVLVTDLGKINSSLKATDAVKEKFRQGEFHLQLTLSPEGGALVLRVLLEEGEADDRRALADIEVVLTSLGKKVFRGLSSPAGELLVRRLGAGEYELSVPRFGAAVSVLITKT